MIVGYGRVGEHLVDVLQSLEVPLLVIELDVERIETLNKRQVDTLYGDPSNSEVITHAGLQRARALVVTVPEETVTFMTVAAARRLNPDLPVIVRAASLESMEHLRRLGAAHIVQPELEGGLEILHDTLLQLGYPLREVHEYAEAVRRDGYDIQINSTDEHRSLHDLVIAADSLEITWLELQEAASILGQTLRQADIRSRTGASVVALIRGGELIPNPKSGTVFEQGDRLGLIGDAAQIESARGLLLES